MIGRHWFYFKRIIARTLWFHTKIRSNKEKMWVSYPRFKEINGHTGFQIFILSPLRFWLKLLAMNLFQSCKILMANIAHLRDHWIVPRLFVLNTENLFECSNLVIVLYVKQNKCKYNILTPLKKSKLHRHRVLIHSFNNLIKHFTDKIRLHCIT